MNKYEEALQNIRKASFANYSASITDYELLQELVERATPINKRFHMFEDGTEWLQCPKCCEDTMDIDGFKFNFCPNCGQALDWSE